MKTVARTSVLVILAAVGGTACTTGRAATPIERPALEVPPPPPRVIVPLPQPEAPVPEPVGELPPSTSKPPRPRPSPPQREPAKPDPKPEAPPEPAPASPVVPPVAPPQLRMPETGDAVAASRQVRDIVERTRRTLNTIDYGALSNVRKKAYDDAKQFAEQAEDALKAANVVFAKELADKAERLARELQGRT
ncbi:MAG: hypothetical protein H0U19_09640 [Acidobacteria bacterium]|nr:hypothetical protein [Acidobacteriota bacterium]